MDKIQAVSILRPGTSWNLRGEVLEQAEDGTPRVSLPKPEEIQAVMATWDYADKRAKAYPPLTDQLDAIWKGGTAMDAMRAQIQAIKAKYPSPVNPDETIKGA